MPALPQDFQTLLTLSVMGVTKFSARGLTQTLSPIDAAKNVRRTINGELVDLAYDQFLKYSTRISCTDQRPPPIDGIWPGQVVEIECVCELSYPIGGSPNRTVVSGSSRTENGFVFYRPRLTMMITHDETQMDEWQASNPWSLEAEEV